MRVDIPALVTVDNAREWESTPEKLTYCIDLMGISAWDRDADRLVNKLEDAFETLLLDL